MNKPGKLHLGAIAFRPVYDDETDAKAKADAEAKALAEKEKEKGNGGAKTFTQEEVNNFLADDRRKHAKKIEELNSTLNSVKTLSTKEKEALAAKVEEMQNQMLTKEQLAAKEAEKLQKAHATELAKHQDEAKLWKNRYESETITRSLVDAAAKGEAFNPDQIVQILKDKTRLVEEVDNEGQPTGRLSPKVKFNDIGKDGKSVVLDVTPDEAIKLMKDKSDTFGNLFKAGVIEGLGLKTSGSKSVGSFDVKDTKQYLKLREQLKKEGKL